MKVNMGGFRNRQDRDILTCEPLTQCTKLNSLSLNFSSQLKKNKKINSRTRQKPLFIKACVCYFLKTC